MRTAIATAILALTALMGLSTPALATPTPVTTVMLESGVYMRTEESSGTITYHTYPWSEHYADLTTCTDGLPVITGTDGQVYGDQDRNGRLDGDDCNWT